jgi:hypothetical protein
MDMRHLELNERFNIVIAWDSFFHLSPDDQRAMFPRFSTHTAGGGVLVFTSGTIESEAVGGDLCGDLLYHGSLSTEEYAWLLDCHGYDVVEHRINDPDCGGHTVWIAQRRPRAESMASLCGQVPPSSSGTGQQRAPEEALGATDEPG